MNDLDKEVSETKALSLSFVSEYTETKVLTVDIKSPYITIVGGQEKGKTKLGLSISEQVLGQNRSVYWASSGVTTFQSIGLDECLLRAQGFCGGSPRVSLDYEEIRHGDLIVM